MPPRRIFEGLPKVKRLADSKTIIVCGNFRGGTTAVAQLLHAVGIPMGERMDPNNNCEDLDFQQLLIQDTVNREELRALIKKRNERYGVWGFKFPGAHVHMPEILTSFRNPHVVYVFRDPYAVGDSEQRRTGQSLYAMMARTVQYNRQMIDLLQQQVCPGHPVSFEHLLVRPEAVIDNLLGFLSITVGRWQRRRLIRSIRLKKDGSSYGYSGE